MNAVAVVAVDAPYEPDGRYSYLVPPALRPKVVPGVRVVVPFGRRRLEGIVLDVATAIEAAGTADEAAGGRLLRPILEVLDDEPPFTPELVRLAVHLAETRLIPPYRLLLSMLPPAVKTEERRLIRWNGDDGPIIALPEEAEVLEWIRDRGPVALEAILRRFPAAGPIVDDFLERGWLAEARVRKPRGRTKTVRFAVPNAAAPALREAAASLRGIRQRAVLETLAERGPTPVAELLRSTGASRSSLEALVDAGWIRFEARPLSRRPEVDAAWRRPAVELTDDQKAAVRAIEGALDGGDRRPILLHGVTGSGKTEVYLAAIEATLARGRTALLLVPEIALTPMMLARVEQRFGDRVAILHSGLGAGERHDEWQRIRRGEASVVVGARSAVFAPLADIGLIVLDEEHEASYKQEETPRYHAREIARWRAAHHGAVFVLGSATPSVESYALARAGRYRLVTLPRRVGSARLPDVRVVDLRKEGGGLLSRPLREAIAERLRRGEQVILLQNRRGYAPVVLCRRCGRAIECPHCAVTLTYHRADGALRCHYCGYEQPMVDRCPFCGNPHLIPLGGGTQRVEEALLHSFPEARVLRMDRDTTGRRGAHAELLGRFLRGEADILVGTQMIAKGLDIPRVTLVGIVLADARLGLPDFRAAERTFQLVTQVAGRAGRGELPGEVIVQTYMPDHPSIRAAVTGDVAAFFAAELAARKKGAYPPFYRLAVVQVDARDARVAREALGAVTERLRMAVVPETIVVGPAPAPIPKLRDRFRFHTLIKYKQEPELASKIRRALREIERPVRRQEVAVTVDFDPETLF
ncbi:MAG: primosomal protein N' [Hydrogenibacillus schlegelii]|nr:primosomal protein N' [Hydrogenibacillus schlegelii]